MEGKIRRMDEVGTIAQKGAAKLKKGRSGE